VFKHLVDLQTLKIKIMNKSFTFQSEIKAEFPIGSMGSSDIKSIDIVIDAYKKFADGEHIEFSGFNTSTGYVYIALENGVQIISNFGQEVEFLVTDMETGEEFFLDTYEQAQRQVTKIWLNDCYNSEDFKVD